MIRTDVDLARASDQHEGAVVRDVDIADPDGPCGGAIHEALLPAVTGLLSGRDRTGSSAFANPVQGDAGLLWVNGTLRHMIVPKCHSRGGICGTP